MNFLITGSAGFIGFHLCNKLLQNKKNILFGVDNLNDYYDVRLKNKRNNILIKKYSNYIFKKIDISDKSKLFNNFKNKKIDIVINLAAQAGVRYSITNPETYIKSNIVGFFNVLELSKNKKVKHLLYASSSSVYGQNDKFPIKEEFNTSSPISMYAASKKSNEILAHAFAYTYKLKCTGLRFFSVYGPYGRPDMALFKFVKNIKNNKKIELYNGGNHERDFTYVDDVVDSIVILIKKPSINKISHQILNIGFGKSIKLMDFVILIEKYLSKKASVKKLKLQTGDVRKTHSDIKKLIKKIKFKPITGIEEGVKNFISWYNTYY
tara:strand:+ start:1322 stop:2287 length:966 start_codon:yes stop_codon:yes gene_type:complete